MTNKENNMEQSQEHKFIESKGTCFYPLEEWRYLEKPNRIQIYTVTYRAIKGDPEKFLSEEEFNALPEDSSEKASATNQYYSRGQYGIYDEYVQENTMPIEDSFPQAHEGTTEYFPNINEVDLRLWNLGQSKDVEEAEGHNNGLTDDQIEDLKECNHTTSIFTFYGTGTKAVAEIRAVWLNFTLHGVLNCMNDIVGNEGINFK